MQRLIWPRELWAAARVNGSISRTSMNDQYGGKTQAVSLTAGLVMGAILLGATGFNRISSRACADLHCDLRSDERCGRTSCCAAIQSQQTGVLYFHGCRSRSPVSGNYLRRSSWNSSVLRGGDPQSHKSAQVFPGNGSGEKKIFMIWEKNPFCLSGKECTDLPVQ